jgi:hypothetical protein
MQLIQTLEWSFRRSVPQSLSYRRIVPRVNLPPVPVGPFVSIIWMIGVSLTLPASISSSGIETETNPAS